MHIFRGYMVSIALLLSALMLAACGGEQTPETPAANGSAAAPVTLSASGDPSRGALVFERRGCAACHAATTDQLVGPGMAGLFQLGGPILPEGVDYGGKLPNGQPITEENVATWIRNGGSGQIGVMPPQNLSDTDMADLLAYLRTLTR
jgi:cytochrome c